jgi:hypothetical protein
VPFYFHCYLHYLSTLVTVEMCQLYLVAVQYSTLTKLTTVSDAVIAVY